MLGFYTNNEPLKFASSDPYLHGLALRIAMQAVLRHRQQPYGGSNDESTTVLLGSHLTSDMSKNANPRSEKFTQELIMTRRSTVDHCGGRGERVPGAARRTLIRAQDRIKEDPTWQIKQKFSRPYPGNTRGAGTNGANNLTGHYRASRSCARCVSSIVSLSHYRSRLTTSSAMTFGSRTFKRRNRIDAFRRSCAGNAVERQQRPDELCSRRERVKSPGSVVRWTLKTL
ncbi:hypothetical protein EVAR_13061_1 [Eumeta japonica]|uniref:Uncharacterized protein n=1 Tax=Eumeta variegata TaxID=151549 RepID=A0A4C1VHR5_EUMVA|nr:hypothetical protein EVAR_13061_1 [Eumeta japonica]